MRNTYVTPAPSVIIDLSPIAMLKGEASWKWVEKVEQAWREQQDPLAKFYGVADNSLWHRFLEDSDDRRSLNDWKRRKIARSVSWADPEVVEIANHFQEAVILTTDLYRDLRGDHPWLQGTDRVWAPVLVGDVISFQQLDYSPITDYEISLHKEASDLTPKGLRSSEARDALTLEWRCANTTCRWSKSNLIEEDPAFQDGKVVCPSCRNPAIQIGPRRRTKEVVLLLEGAEVDRLPIPEGSVLTVGRGRGVGRYDVREILNENDANRFSRDHLKLTNIGGRIVVEDLDSKNGTQIMKEDRLPSLILASAQEFLEPNVLLVPAGGSLSIRLSGKRRPCGTYEPDLETPPFLREEAN